MNYTIATQGATEFNADAWDGASRLPIASSLLIERVVPGYEQQRDHILEFIEERKINNTYVSSLRVPHT